MWEPKQGGEGRWERGQDGAGSDSVERRKMSSEALSVDGCPSN